MKPGKTIARPGSACGRAMKRANRLIPILLGVCVMLNLFGCGKQKYKLHFDGYGFQSRRSAYAAGETVTVYYGPLATDTDYRFWLDDESVKLTQGYDERHGYVFTFTMPAHELTLHAEHRNSMEYVPVLNVSFRNEVEQAQIWLLPQTEANLKTSLWGTPSARLGVGESAELRLTEDETAETWMVRIIDEDHALYSAQDLKLEDGDTVVFRCEGDKFDAVIEVLDPNGAVIFSAEAFTGVLGAG